MTGIGHPANSALPRAPRPLRVPRLRRRTILTVAAVAVIGLIAFNVGRQAFLGWSVGEQASTLEAQVAAKEAEIAALQRQLEYLQSDAYVTAEARRLRNLGYPGEQVLIIPPDAAVPPPLTAAPPAADERPMLERWLQLFFGPPAPESSP
jgi:cell division protein FtsB